MKIFWLKPWRLVFMWVVAMLLIQGCEKDDPNPEPEPEPDITVYEFIQSMYYYIYYWNKEVDSYISRRPPTSGDPGIYFESLKYNSAKASSSDRNAGSYDRWGFMTTYLDYAGVMVEGTYKSFGYDVDLAPDGSIRVNHVYENSPMANAGIERGYEVLKLNGTDVTVLLGNKTIGAELNKETNRFVFADREGTPLEEMTISKAEVNINPILCKTTYNVNGKKVGYIAYNTFIVASKNAITAALQEMKDVDEFILDLRYNGGGSVAVAEAMCEHLLPQSAGTDSVAFAKFAFSDLTKQRLKWKDEITKIKRHSLAMNLSRLFVITTIGTASASEELINDMKPFLDVITVGAATNGKPVGMFVQFYPPYSYEEIEAGALPEWAFAPITFRNDNKNGEGGYFSGIAANYSVSDDLYHDFGVDSETLEGEACLQSILDFIKTGSFPLSISAKANDLEKPEVLQLNGLQIQAGCR